LLVSLAGAGCGGSGVETSALTDTSAVTGAYAPESGVDQPAPIASPHARRFHLVTRRVRHRHAGPR
jgi:hypothetical protein